MEPNGLNIEEEGLIQVTGVVWVVSGRKCLEVKEGVDWEGRDRRRQKCPLSLGTGSLPMPAVPLCL